MGEYSPTWWQRVACRFLEWAERRFLHAHGWVPSGLAAGKLDGRYWPPDDYTFQRKFYTYDHGHAVNAQKQRMYNPMHGGTRTKA